jgi:hypothetical protein
LLRDIILVIDCLNWTYRLACSAVNALIWMNVEHAVALVDAIYRAFFNAGLVFQVHAWESNDVGHISGILPSRYFTSDVQKRF